MSKAPTTPLNIIIPVNGLGSRFSEQGYTVPKPLIPVLGQPMLVHVMSELRIQEYDYVYIPYTTRLDFYDFQTTIKEAFPDLNITFIPIEKETKGAADTVLYALQQCPDMKELPVLVADCDNVFHGPLLDQFRESIDSFEKMDWNLGGGVIFYAENTDKDPIYSYVQLSPSGKYVDDIKEKDKISDNICVGAYGFISTEYLKEDIDNLINYEGVHRAFPKNTKEYYISMVYKHMFIDNTIERRQKSCTRTGVKAIKLEPNAYSCVGTPEQLKAYCASWGHTNRKTFCFDLDHTLVTSPEVAGDYTTCKPIEKAIKLVQYLNAKGHNIIIHTARRMLTHGGNVDKVMADIGDLTYKQLFDLNIPYNQVVFGKPYADFYIDDKAVTNFDIEKQIGFYDIHTAPRSFNNIEIDGDKVTKTGKVAAEYDYHIEIAADYPHLKSMFPKMLEESSQSKLVTERVDGVTVSSKLLDNSLTRENLNLVMSNLWYMHNNAYDMKSDWIFYETSELFRERFDKAQEILGTINLLSAVPLCGEVRDMLSLKYHQLPVSVIHGDPVFSNVLMTENSVKFIDMRGKIGDKHTIGGWPLYDLAKVYQSLRGYDFILNDRTPICNGGLLAEFEHFVAKHYSIRLRDIKIFTSALLISLIPLHDDIEKQKKYAELAYKVYFS